MRSDDAGATWRRVRRATPVSVALDPARPGRMVVSERGGVVESTDGGRRWSRLPALPTRFDPGDLRLAVDRRSVVYASSELGAFRLGAGRARWVALRRGALAPQRARIVLADPRRPRGLLAVVAPHLGPDRVAWSGGGGGSRRLVEGGLAARAVRGLALARRPASPLVADTARGLFTLRRPGERWARVGPPAPGALLAAAPRDPRRLVVSTEDGVAVSHDGGRSWARRPIPEVHPLYSALVSLRVLDDATGTVMAVVGSHGSRECSGLDELAVGRSLGRSWFIAATPLARIDALAVDPANAATTGAGRGRRCSGRLVSS